LNYSLEMDMETSAIIQQRPLGFTWDTVDPFLLCVHHDDAYPRGNGRLGPDASLAGRDIGQDFVGKDGWRMYHGQTIPGFPSHPHRGFETVTIVRKGFIDHADSLGAAARFGDGDVQWLTAGRGVVHSEMFPLLRTDRENPLELFQIWLNLPASKKMAEPHFTMFWSEDIPRHVSVDAQGRTTEITVIAGHLPVVQGANPPLPPPPHSWAATPAADVAIWTIKMAPNAQWTLPAAANAATRRNLYFFEGARVTIDGKAITEHAAFELRPMQAVQLINGNESSEFLLLQGRPINETVVQSGPFVMNSPQEIAQAFADYSRTRFGGWPWPDTAPVHGNDYRRFATYADGQTQTKPLAHAA
jgi:quercetin 2,3-dioxygenase